MVKCFCDETERQEVDTLDVYLVNLKLASDVSPPYSNHEKDKATEIASNQKGKSYMKGVRLVSLFAATAEKKPGN